MNQILILLILGIIFISVIGIYNARNIIKTRGKIKDVNNIVKWFKIICFVIIIISVIFLNIIR